MDFRDSLFDAIHDIVRADPRSAVLTNDMGAMGFDAIRAEFPDRAINVGIAEQNLISVASGLALSGIRVFAFGIAAHVATRCLEQIKLDLCVPHADVVLIGFGPGLAYGADGPTHHATEDVALMRALPGMAVYTPADPPSAHACVRLAHAAGGPAYIRLDREAVPCDLPPPADATGLRVVHAAGEIAMVTHGILLHSARAAIAAAGVETRLIDLYRIKPIDEEALLAALSGVRAVIAAEEHNPVGGLGAALCEIAMRRRAGFTVDTLALPDRFLTGAATRAWAHREFGLDETGLAAALHRLAE
ncbi:putative 1-deoxy-D-xylulose-5-phosphate synthase [uncultured Alphaproteobacteria bacterium]|uniref:Putative 1-deoxy-D-xylulose-5-phosphate synthase n=1 Tax=uncultured Alphaproteobacteria bacterium TaxID=91750 RepID=A0A212JPS1_9PROT|nr:putative 1-deoxy-D-xylulose-5-phosphate synthase [uncultured Alphaproteobacteria bacterium]